MMELRMKVVVENGRLRSLEPLEFSDGEVLEIAILTPLPATSGKLNEGPHLNGSGGPEADSNQSRVISGAEERARTFEADLRAVQEAFAQLPFEARRELVELWEGPEAAASYRDSAV